MYTDRFKRIGSRVSPSPILISAGWPFDVWWLAASSLHCEATSGALDEAAKQALVVHKDAPDIQEHLRRVALDSVRGLHVASVDGPALRKGGRAGTRRRHESALGKEDEVVAREYDLPDLCAAPYAC